MAAESDPARELLRHPSLRLPTAAKTLRDVRRSSPSFAPAKRPAPRQKYSPTLVTCWPGDYRSPKDRKLEWWEAKKLGP